MRDTIRYQLGILDEEYRGKSIPQLSVKQPVDDNAKLDLQEIKQNDERANNYSSQLGNEFDDITNDRLADI
jgi:hypothetical protein